MTSTDARKKLATVDLTPLNSLGWGPIQTDGTLSPHVFDVLLVDHAR